MLFYDDGSVKMRVHESGPMLITQSVPNGAREACNYPPQANGLKACRIMKETHTNCHSECSEESKRDAGVEAETVLEHGAL